MNREITSRDEGDAQSSKAAVLRGRKHLIASKAMEQRLGSRAEKVHLPAGLESRGMSQHFGGGRGIRAQGVALEQNGLKGLGAAHLLCCRESQKTAS